MIRGLYTAASGLDVATLQQEILAENLANANVPGYRRRGISFEAIGPGQDQAASAATSSGGVRAFRIYDSPEAGPAQPTGNPLDLMALGNAYFVLDGPKGTLYTRNGAFRLSPSGELLSENGYRVQGDGGPLQIPNGTTRIEVGPDGRVLANGAEVGKLRMVRISSLQGMQRVGTTLFEGNPPQQTGPDEDTNVVQQGFREGSNVQVVLEMVTMLAGQRAYEAAQRSLRTLGDSLGQHTRPTN
jgi:flagellar basal body rod protein FlgG